MVRYDKLSRFGRDVDLVISPFSYTKEYDESMVDESFFVSSVDIASRIKASNLSQGVYDTAEDLARGFTVDVFARQRGVDLAEISTLKDEFESKLRDSITSLYEQLDEATSVKNVINSSVKTDEKSSVKTDVNN